MQLKRISITQKFLLFLCFLFVVATTDSLIFIVRSRQIALYDNLTYRLNDAKFSMIKLEYILDMFVVARHFEEDKLTLIVEDIKKVDKSIRELESLGYTKFLDDVQVSSSIKHIVEDWQTIKNEFDRLDAALDYDVVLLIHNAVDMNTFLFAEKTEKLLADIASTRTSNFEDIAVAVTVTLVVSLFVVFAGSLFFVWAALLPVRVLERSARQFLSGDESAVFSDNRTREGAEISAAFNKVVSAATEARFERETESISMSAEIESAEKQLSVLRDLACTVGESLSQNEIFSAALNGAIVNTGADAAAIYLTTEKNTFELKASSGIDSSELAEVSEVSSTERIFDIEASGDEIEITDLDEYPDGKLKTFLSSRGFSSIVTAPIPYNKSTIGFIILEFKLRASFTESSVPFIKAIVSLLGAAAGHVDFFQSEYEKKFFLERIIEQSPVGYAAFDNDGSAIMLNSTLRKMLGVSKDSDFIRRYKLFEDNVLESEGALSHIRESFDGHIGEAIVDYDPTLLTWYDFTGDPLRLRIKSYPLYDAGGAIAGVILLYENTGEESSPVHKLRSI
ncbi:MAG: GAF domain-containing protein [Thermodesulfobacteriota bacterium]